MFNSRPFIGTMGCVQRTTCCLMWIGVAVWALLGCGSPPLIIPQPGTIATDFTLTDQYGREFRLSQFRGEDVLLLGCDKDSMGHGGTWFDILQNRYTDRLQILAIANGASLPLFVRLFLKGRIKTELREAGGQSDSPSILLDWDGKVSRQYGMSDKRCTVVFIDRDRRIRFVQPLGQLTEQEMLTLFDLINREMGH